MNKAAEKENHCFKAVLLLKCFNFDLKTIFETTRFSLSFDVSRQRVVTHV